MEVRIESKEDNQKKKSVVQRVSTTIETWKLSRERRLARKRTSNWIALSSGNKRRSLVTWCEQCVWGRKWPKSADRLFRYMHLTMPETRALYGIFYSTKKTADPTLSIGEIMDRLRLEATDYAIRVFGLKEQITEKRKHITGRCDFEGFVVSLWSMCSLPMNELSFFIFELYDTDESGYLDFDELKNLVVDVSTSDFARSERIVRILQDLRTAIDESPYEAMNKFEFDTFCAERPLLLAPAMQLQDRAMCTFGGTVFWKKILRRRDILAGGKRFTSNEKAGHAAMPFAVLRRLLLHRGEIDLNDDKSTALNTSLSLDTSRRGMKDLGYTQQFLRSLTSGIATTMRSQKTFPSGPGESPAAFSVSSSHSNQPSPVDDVNGRHRNRKLKLATVTKAAEQRTLSFSTRRDTTGTEAPVLVQFRRQKCMTLDMLDEIEHIGRSIKNDSKMILDKQFLDDTKLTKDMRRERSLEEDVARKNIQRQDLIRWTQYTEHVDTVLEEHGDELYEILQKRIQRLDVGDGDALRSTSATGLSPYEEFSKDQPSSNEAGVNNMSEADLNFVRTVTEDKNKAKARRLWQKIRFRAKHAHTRILADRRDALLEANQNLQSQGSISPRKRNFMKQLTFFGQSRRTLGLKKMSARFFSTTPRSPFSRKKVTSFDSADENFDQVMQTSAGRVLFNMSRENSSRLTQMESLRSLDDSATSVVGQRQDKLATANAKLRRQLSHSPKSSIHPPSRKQPTTTAIVQKTKKQEKKNLSRNNSSR